VVVATVAGGTAVCAVEAGAGGVVIDDGRVTLDHAPAVALVDGGDGLAEALRQRMVAGLCAEAAGITAAAVELTAAYVKEREQFGKQLATFQAVSQRAADAYIDATAVRLTALQAAWRLGGGLPAAREVAIAKFWASEGGQRVIEAAMHLHGGIGVDRDYPLHRYYERARAIDLRLGAAPEQLGRIGDLLAQG
jgi:alkylation response protein AidB-like acyl-CoA dehydrogenase